MGSVCWLGLRMAARVMPKRCQPSDLQDPVKLGNVLRPVVDDLYGLGIGDDWTRRVLRKMSMCGTGELGYGLRVCDDCKHYEGFGMACRDRHCPSCGHKKAKEWEAARCDELVEGPYFHYVFTVPGALYPLFCANRRVLYDLFHRVVRELILRLAADKRFLGGTPWAMSVLHTTNQQLGYHPHIHVLLGGVGWNESTDTMVRTAKDDFLFPARALASGLRGRFLMALRELVKSEEQELELPSQYGGEGGRRAVLLATIENLFEVNWQVHTKAAYGGAVQTVRYLARYVERTAISNRRLLELTDETVTFQYTNRKLGRKRRKTVRLLEFARLFERHILPKGFVRIRRFGLLSTHKRKHLLPRVQQAAAQAAGQQDWTPPVPTLEPESGGVQRCRACGSTKVKLVDLCFRTDIPLIIGRQPRPPPMPKAPGRAR